MKPTFFNELSQKRFLLRGGRLYEVTSIQTLDTINWVPSTNASRNINGHLDFIISNRREVQLRTVHWVLFVRHQWFANLDLFAFSKWWRKFTFPCLCEYLSSRNLAFTPWFCFMVEFPLSCIAWSGVKRSWQWNRSRRKSGYYTALKSAGWILSCYEKYNHFVTFCLLIHTEAKAFEMIHSKRPSFAS